MQMDVITTARTCKHMIREMIDLKRITLLVLGHKITDTAYGVNFHFGTTLGELLSEAMDVDFDGVRGDPARKTNKMVLGQLLRYHATLAAHQKFEHGELTRREYFRPVIDEHLPTFKI